MSALLGHLSSENPLNYFELLGPLGQGSYGEVVKARLVSTAELVAVKLISVEPNDSAMMSSVHKEIDILQSCTHDNIVRYRGSFLSEETLWVRLHTSIHVF
jgi:serine/threonine protein kinase